MTQELNDKLMDIFFAGGDGNWKSSKPDYDLDHINGLEIEVNPKDATDINQVESFTISEEVMGTVYTDLKKRKITDL